MQPVRRVYVHMYDLVSLWKLCGKHFPTDPRFAAGLYFAWAHYGCVRITNGKVEGGVYIYAETIDVASFDSIIVQSR